MSWVGLSSVDIIARCRNCGSSSMITGLSNRLYNNETLLLSFWCDGTCTILTLNLYGSLLFGRADPLA